MELFKEVASIINRNKRQTIEIKPQDSLREDLYIDSFETLMIVCDLEDQFHITLDPDEIKSMKFVQDIVDNLEMKICGFQTINT